ncbi:MAG: host attachment protein [Xanthobacteraceae bacterium]|nr:host attachment protein [Xanthobacteraceae bacterium]
MILPHGALVVVADGSNLHLFMNKAVEPEIELVPFSHPAILPSNAGSGLRHHSESSNPDAHRKAEDGFAAAIAGQLNRMALDGAIDRIFVVADPRTLGELRKHFHAALRSRIVGELSKDLTGHSSHDIALAVRKA